MDEIHMLSGGAAMYWWKKFSLMVLFLIACSPKAGFAAAPAGVKDLIAAANKEGSLDFYAPTQVEDVLRLRVVRKAANRCAAAGWRAPFSTPT
jgi:hypothetical protein